MARSRQQGSNSLQNTRDAFTWSAVREATGSVSSFTAKLSSGKLVTEVPLNPSLVCSKIPDRTNHPTAARFVNDELKLSWPAIIHEEVLNVCSDAAVCTRKAAAPFKGVLS